ncbi:MAG: hypothetical protein JXR58_03665 [Bacteroidales bacterium]|nr:hypothetical protein [Bacteroidales bacterium]
MKKNTFSIIFEFRTYISEDIPDFAKELSFIPATGMNIYIDSESHIFPDEIKDGGWFKVEDTDYLLKDDVFVISLKDASEYVFKEEDN